MRLMAHDGWSTAEIRGKIEDLFHSVVDSIRQVIPAPASVQPAILLDGSAAQSDFGVLVGFTGDFYGRIVIQGNGSTFGKLGESMFGMPLEGDILYSFIGELANMIAGNTSTIIYGKGRKIDITPPTVMAGELQMFGFEKGISIPVEFADAGDLTIILTIQNQGAA